MCAQTKDVGRLRFEGYLAFASLPVAAVAGTGLAEIIHYGGPAIRIDRDVHQTQSDEGFYHGVHVGASTLGFANSGMGSLNARNVSVEVGLSSNFAGVGAQVRMGRVVDLGFGDVSFAICGYASLGQIGGIAGSLLGGEISSFCNLLQRFDAGEAIGSKAPGGFADSGAVAMSATGQATLFGQTIADASFAAGGWTAADNVESRGYAGIQLDLNGVDAFGWVEFGWDGDVMTIYDWAYDTTGGSIAAGDVGATAVPGATGLAALALGAAGLRRKRKSNA